MAYDVLAHRKALYQSLKVGMQQGDLDKMTEALAHAYNMGLQESVRKMRNAPPETWREEKLSKDGDKVTIWVL